MNVETPADIAQEWWQLSQNAGQAPLSPAELEARIIKAVRIQDIVRAQGPLRPGQVLLPELKCPHCHNVMMRWAWLTTDDGRARVHYCEFCKSVLNVEAVSTVLNLGGSLT